MISKHATQVIM